MSSDNGIYILETSSSNGRGFEYRVAHLGAIDNINWDDKLECEMMSDDVRIKNAREMWGGCNVYRTIDEALLEAHKISKKIDFTEYGIVTITVNRIF